MAKTTPGIRVRHGRSCASRGGARCNCSPSYEAWVWSERDGRKLRRTFRNLAEAKGWRHDAASAVRKGTMAAPSRLTVAEAAEHWLADAKAGVALTRSGKRYKPSLIRTHESDLRRNVLPYIGAVKLASLRRRDVQQLVVDRLVAAGYAGSTVRRAVMPLRVICRRALENDELLVNPTANLRLPEADGTRDRVASPEEAALLLAAVPGENRALWATAFYAGLRRGELRAFRWSDVDEAVTAIHVRRSWDDKDGEVEPKSRKGSRRVPVSAALRLHLLEHKARTGRRGDELVFGRSGEEPFTSTWIRKRALRAWEAAGLEPIGLHECRHTYVSMMHAAGLSLERIGDYVGHSSAYMTDRYRHLLDGHEEEAAAALDEYLARSTGAHTGAQAAGGTLRPLG
jgi:integrase